MRRARRPRPCVRCPRFCHALIGARAPHVPGAQGRYGRAARGAARVCSRSGAGPREHVGRPAARARYLQLFAAAERDEGGAGAGSEGASERGAGVAVLTPDADKATAVEKKESVAFKGNWRVLLHRDEWYTFDYCEDWLIRVVPILTRKKVLPNV